MQQLTCTFPGCDNPRKGRKELCGAHCSQVYRGRPLTPVGVYKLTVEQRFWKNVQKTETCWLWTAPTFDGYGRFWTGERRVPAHRYSYEVARGHLEKSTLLDHICHNRACVNPDHLRIASRKQNGEYRKGANTNNRSTGVRNVYFDGTCWKVSIGHQGKKLYFGRYTTLAEAEQVAARERARLFTFPEAQAS